MSRPVYLAANPVEAEIVRDYLGSHGIGVEVRGSYAWGGVGELPHTESYPRLHLENESDRDRARQLIKTYESGGPVGQRCCHKCQEVSPASFAVCWNCSSPFEPD